MVFEFVSGEPFNSLVEVLGNDQEVDELTESFDGLCIISHDGCPSCLRGVVEFHFIDFGDVCIDGSYVGYHGGCGECNK